MGSRKASRRERPVRDWADVATPRADGRLALVCAECGQPFTPVRRDATFCSRACAQRERRRTARHCASCRRTLTSQVQATAKFCSTACRMRAYRRRKAAGGGAP